MSISIATFAYVGVEVVAASALEAKSPHPAKNTSTASDMDKRLSDSQIGHAFKFSAVFIPIFATITYTLSGVLGTLDISRRDCALPRLSWLPKGKDDHCKAMTSRAAFVVIASKIPHLADLFNAFLVFTCLSCAGTNLYVASRTLFGLTSRLDGGEGQRWYLRALAWFGKTDRRQVPLRAMILSAVSLWWVPFLQLIRGTSDTQASVNMVRLPRSVNSKPETNTTVSL
jgi:amino acid transporter